MASRPGSGRCCKLFRPVTQDFEMSAPKTVRALFTDHASGRQDNHKILFSLVVFEEWLRAQMDLAPAMSGAPPS